MGRELRDDRRKWGSAVQTREGDAEPSFGMEVVDGWMYEWMNGEWKGELSSVNDVSWVQ